jgi:two-component system cell cycle sensor histidine kinase/response regulator CckA
MTDNATPFALVVDAEPLVRSVLANYLRLLGLGVLEASSGPEALELLSGSGHSIAVALIDVRLRGMSGPKVLEEFRRLRPDLPCCLMSGELSDERLLLAAGARCVLRKPFRLAELADCLADCELLECGRAST